MSFYCVVTAPEKLHLAALASLKGEIIDLTNQLQHVTAERDILEKQLNKAQLEKLRLIRETENRLEKQTVRYEERLVELHGVIGELKKKIIRQSNNVIREEDEYSESRESNHSNGDTLPSNDNNANHSVHEEEACENADLTAELSRIVTDLECAVKEGNNVPTTTSKKVVPVTVQPVIIQTDSADADSSSVEERAIQVCREMESLRFESRPTPTQENFAAAMLQQIQQEKSILRQENIALQEQLGRQESELNKTKAVLGGQREERDRLKKKVRDLQHKLQIAQTSSPAGSLNSSPNRCINPSTGERSVSSRDEVPVTKIAERVRLKKVEQGDRQILGSEISSVGLQSAKVAEHLTSSLTDCSDVEEIIQNLLSHGSSPSETKVQEFEVEMERSNSRIEHLKSQNDLLTLTLEESKTQCDRLSVLIGKYESNNTALQLAVSYSDQAIEAYETLMLLIEAEQSMLLVNCRAAGLGNLVNNEVEQSEDLSVLLRRCQENRKQAETTARHMVQRLDRNCGIMCTVPGCSPNPWEDVSSGHSHTTSTTSSTSSSCTDEFTKIDEQRLKDYISQLKSDRTAVRTTILELESIHIDPMSKTEPVSAVDGQKLDLENAVLMQELMAMKEEKAELKAVNYMLEKEKKALELRLSSCDAHEQAYQVQIDHLKSEVKDLQSKIERYCKKDVESESEEPNPNIELQEAVQREQKLKNRIQELLATLETLSKNSEIRHQQSGEFVNDLKRANSALIAAFEKAKKKHQAKVRKLEQQITTTLERHECQTRMLKQRISSLEEECAKRSSNETSL